VTIIERSAGRGPGAFGVPAGTDRLADLVRAVAADEGQWRPRVQHRPYRRHYERLAVDDASEVWLICWDVGQMTLLHDHGGAAGAFAVVTGTLLEDYGRPGSGRLRQRRVSRGGCRAFGPNHVHNLVNAGPGLATSIHAYSPRLNTMTYYAVLPGGAVPVRTLCVDEPEPPAT
jgi:predicted metal-dependent enzyme (double-stranded beta helix superfamily)